MRLPLPVCIGNALMSPPGTPQRVAAVLCPAPARAGQLIADIAGRPVICCLSCSARVRWGAMRAGSAAGLSRAQARAERRRAHEARKKAKAIDKANDKQRKLQNKQGKDMDQKKTEKKQKKEK